MDERSFACWCDSTLSYYMAQSGHALDLFNTSMGKLQWQLYNGECSIFKHALMFKSDFFQKTRSDQCANSVQIVTVGITFTNPSPAIPDVMLLGSPAVNSAEDDRHDGNTQGRGHKFAKSLEVTSLLPLKFIKLSTCNNEKKKLYLKFASGHTFCLQLCPPSDVQEDLCASWEDLVYLLRPPVGACVVPMLYQLATQCMYHVGPWAPMLCLLHRLRMNRSHVSLEYSGELGRKDTAALLGNQNRN
uniref:Golgi associated RAB2 interactor protein-like Rab2B-binding domain-containing protein n=1 Tax=Prolemur simus TaxID=1328070 RepID=A0A8C8ZXT7_PROSS